MSAALIAQTRYPLTASTLADQLRRCGLRAGHTALVHMAMSRMGWVIGGAEAVLHGLLAAVGPSGTLMVPTHTNNNTDPAEWQNPPIPQAWWQLVRDHMPPFNPATTPSSNMGAVAELLRTWPGAQRSSHPVTSFAALGPNADVLIANHPLDDETGDRSPLGRLYELDGLVVLLGVTHWNNTSLHLAEARANYPGKRTLHTGSAVLRDGRRQWVEYEVLETHGEDFGAIGAAFDTAHPVAVQQIGNAEVRVFPQRAVVDFAVAWIEQHRDLRS